jgi:hypothetical protein
MVVTDITLHAKHEDLVFVFEINLGCLLVERLFSHELIFW